MLLLQFLIVMFNTDVVVKLIRAQFGVMLKEVDLSSFDYLTKSVQLSVKD